MVAAICGATGAITSMNTGEKRYWRKQKRSRTEHQKLMRAHSSTNETAVFDLSNNFSVDNVRHSLIQQEDSIIFSLIERAALKVNPPVYQPGSVPVPAYKTDGSRCSLLEFLLRETELVQGRVRRYTSPDEHQFFPEQQPLLALPPLVYGDLLHPEAKSINVNSTIYTEYMQHIVPRVAHVGDDNNHGSAAHADVLCLQAISKRVHFGKFVAEAKFAAEPEEYTQLASLALSEDASPYQSNGVQPEGVYSDAPDGAAAPSYLDHASASVVRNVGGDTSEESAHDALLRKLTDSAVEQRVVRRVQKKAETFGQDIDGVDDGEESTEERERISYKVRPTEVARIFSDWIMPLTKAVQVSYLKLKCSEGL